MKAVVFELGKKKLYLAYNGEAMFEIEEKHGDVKELADKLGSGTRDGFSAACEVAAILAEQGELTRRYYGYDPQESIPAEGVRLMVQPSQVTELTDAIFRSIALGFGREIESGKDDEIDLGLAELNQKKTN